MNLLTKFAILAALLALAAIVSVGSPTWAIHTADRQVMSAQAKLVVYISALDRIRGAFQAAYDQVNGSSLNTDERRRLAARVQSIIDALEQIEDSDAFRQFAGAGMAPALADRIHVARADFAHLLTTDDEAFDGELVRTILVSLSQVQSLLDLVQRHLLEELHFSIEHGRDVRRLVTRIFITSLITALLLAGLTIILLRRWVIAPVLALRTATHEIAAGNLNHRVTVSSRDELGALSRDVNHMASELARAQAELIERERFAAVEDIVRRLAHNLRNPLAGIRSLAESARMELSVGSPVREDQELIIATVDRFEAWLGELVHSSSPLRIELQDESPADLLEGVMATHRLMAQAKQVELQLDSAEAPERARYDAVHLEHAMVALTTNAIEAASEGGTVRLSLRTGTENGEWELRVEDSGPGVDPRICSDIFSPYFTTKRMGTGMGLAYVRNVVQAHHGRIEHGRSELGGAIFIMRLPGAEARTAVGAGDGAHRDR